MKSTRRTRRIVAILLATGVTFALPAIAQAQMAPTAANTTPACTGDDAAETTQCGTAASASGPLSVAVGTGALATNEETTAIGWHASATGINATAVGGDATAAGFVSDAFGTGSFAQGDQSLALGHQAWSAGEGSIAAGLVAYVEGTSSISIGRFSDTRGNDAVVIGGSSAFDILSGAGTSPTTGTLGSYAFGNGATVVGGQARVGYDANTSPADVTPTVAADLGTAIGFQSVVDQARGTAVGANAHAVFAGSTAVGSGAVTTAANQVALGASGSSVRLGDVAAGTAAQSGATTVMTVDANGVVGADSTIRPALAALQSGQSAQATRITALQASQTVMTGQIGTLFDLAQVNKREIGKANEGVAMALSMESPVLPAGAHVGVAGGFGYYNNRVAGSASVALRLGDRSAFSAGVGVGMKTGEVGARAGFQAAW